MTDRPTPGLFFFCCRLFFLRLFSPYCNRRHDTQQSYPHTAFTNELQGCWYVLTATLTTVNVDEPLADVSLAAFGRKEIQIAEVCLVTIVRSRVLKIRLIE
jgi:hypothetical protein